MESFVSIRLLAFLIPVSSCASASDSSGAEPLMICLSWALYLCGRDTELVVGGRAQIEGCQSRPSNALASTSQSFDTVRTHPWSPVHLLKTVRVMMESLSTGLASASSSPNFVPFRSRHAQIVAPWLQDQAQIADRRRTLWYSFIPGREYAETNSEPGRESMCWYGRTIGSWEP